MERIFSCMIPETQKQNTTFSCFIYYFLLCFTSWFLNLQIRREQSHWFQKLFSTFAINSHWWSLIKFLSMANLTIQQTNILLPVMHSFWLRCFLIADLITCLLLCTTTRAAAQGYSRHPAPEDPDPGLGCKTILLESILWLQCTDYPTCVVSSPPQKNKKIK